MDFIKKYKEAGYHVMRLKPRNKIPMDKNWKAYNGPWNSNWNVGIALGERSQNIVDLDLDWPEACKVASLVFGTENLAIFGRKSKEKSHYIFKSALKKRLQFTLPKSFSQMGLPEEHAMCVLELRSTGGLTMFPPSKHPSGEAVEWHNFIEPPMISPEDLTRKAGIVAFFAVCNRFWPGEGHRHNAAFTFAGICKWAEIPEEVCASLVRLVSQADNEIDSRLRTVSDTYSSLEVTSKWAAFFECFGFPEDSQKVFNKWLGLSSNNYISKDSGTTKQPNGPYKDKYYFMREGSKVGVAVQDFDETFKRKVWHIMSCHQFILFEPSESAYKWTKKALRYEGFIFKPEGEPVVDNKINLWEGWAIKPQAGSWELIKLHIHEVIANGNEEHANYFIKWLAWSYQNPDKPAEVALVMQGGRGTGKSIIARAFIESAGQHGIQVSSPNQITGRFNSHMRDCIFFFADEAFWAGEKSAEGQLKRMITEPTLVVEQKHRDAVVTANRLHIIIASNEEWIVPAGERERRFAVYEVSDKYQQDKPYFKALSAEMNNGGWAAFMDHLFKLDLQGWHPREDIPTSAGLQNQIALSEDPIKTAFRRCLEEGILPGTAHPYDKPDQVFFQSLLEHIRRQAFGASVTPTRLGRFLGKIPNVRKFDGKKFHEKTLYGKTYKQGIIYEMPPLGDVRKWFDPHAAWDESTGWKHSMIDDDSEGALGSSAADAPDLSF